MTVDVDPILLNLRAPLVDAVCATMCSEWGEAADLWLETGRDPDCRDLASQCGVQAAVNAGLLDLAEYFRIGVAALPVAPDFVTDLWERNATVRQARARYFSHVIAMAGGKRRPASGRELIRLHLYREAIREIFVSGEFRSNPRQALPLLARAYSMLGAHDSLIGLYKTYKSQIQDDDVLSWVQRAERLISRRAEPGTRNLQRFQEQHPAGAALTSLIEAKARRVAA